MWQFWLRDYDAINKSVFLEKFALSCLLLPIYLFTCLRVKPVTIICFDSYAIVSDMSAAGLGLNKYCYAGLITAFKNKTPTTEETMAKVHHTWHMCKLVFNLILVCCNLVLFQADSWLCRAVKRLEICWKSINGQCWECNDECVRGRAVQSTNSRICK